MQSLFCGVLSALRRNEATQGRIPSKEDPSWGSPAEAARGSGGDKGGASGRGRGEGRTRGGLLCLLAEIPSLLSIVTSTG